MNVTAPRPDQSTRINTGKSTQLGAPRGSTPGKKTPNKFYSLLLPINVAGNKFPALFFRQLAKYCTHRPINRTSFMGCMKFDPSFWQFFAAKSARDCVRTNFTSVYFPFNSHLIGKISPLALTAAAAAAAGHDKCYMTAQSGGRGGEYDATQMSSAPRSSDADAIFSDISGWFWPASPEMSAVATVSVWWLRKVASSVVDTVSRYPPPKLSKASCQTRDGFPRKSATNWSDRSRIVYFFSREKS